MILAHWSQFTSVGKPFPYRWITIRRTHGVLLAAPNVPSTINRAFNERTSRVWLVWRLLYGVMQTPLEEYVRRLEGNWY